MEKLLEAINSAERSLKTTDHMIYVTFPIVKDKRILLKAIQEIKNSITECIKVTLQHEYLFKRIKLYQDPRANFKTFLEKCAARNNITNEEIKLMLELFDYIEKHNESPFEFMKGDKIIILSGNLQPKTLTVEKTKEFLILGKDILRKTKENILKNY